MKAIEIGENVYGCDELKPSFTLDGNALISEEIY